MAFTAGAARTAGSGHATAVPDPRCAARGRLARLRGDDRPWPARRAVASAVRSAGRVNRVRVVILGAGLSGMTAAYELAKVGFDCRVLEARARPGGRVFTVRRGTASEETGPTQTATFDDGLYFNAGPMRISHHHHTTLEYCRELRVATEVFVPDCESAYLAQTRGPLAGRRIRLREARADLDGYIAELLSKSLSQVQLDQPLTAADRERVLTYLRSLGALTEAGVYRGS